MIQKRRKKNNNYNTNHLNELNELKLKFAEPELYSEA